MDRPTILIADADEGLRRSLRELLVRQGDEVVEVPDKPGILRCLHERSPDLVIVGSSQNGSWDSLEVAREIRRREHRLPLILITAESTEDLAIAALKAGITDYFKRPFSLNALGESVDRLLTTSGMRVPSAAGLADPDPAEGRGVEGPRLVGSSPAIRAILGCIARAAATDSNVLITGETGTGKELVAELIHRNGPRRHRPLVRINCAAIPDGLLESELFGHEKGAFTGAYAAQDGKLRLAEHGTAFFDEIGDMSPYAQAKILRVIETKEACRLGGSMSVPLDIRVVAATNQDVEPLVAEGKFRRDLYFRLNVVRIHLPPLRDRKEDIPALIDHCLRDINRRLGADITAVTAEALAALLRYDWPGNVRELKNVLEAVAVDVPSGSLDRRNLPKHLRRWSAHDDTASAGDAAGNERERVLSALFQANWNKCKAAEHLHWSRMTLYRKMAKYRIIRGGATGEPAHGWPGRDIRDPHPP